MKSIATCLPGRATRWRCGSKGTAGTSRSTAVGAGPWSRMPCRASSCCWRLRVARWRCAGSGCGRATASPSTCRTSRSRCSGPRPASASAWCTRPCSAASATRRCRIASTTPARAWSSLRTAVTATRRSWPSRRPIPTLRWTATCPRRWHSWRWRARCIRWRCPRARPGPSSRAHVPRSPARSPSSAPMSCAGWAARSRVWPASRRPRRAGSARPSLPRWSRRRRGSTRSSSCGTRRRPTCCGVRSVIAGRTN